MAANEENFYVAITSNSEEKYGDKNTATTFTKSLAEPIPLEGVWEAALVDFQFPSNWPNVPERCVPFKFLISKPHEIAEFRPWEMSAEDYTAVNKGKRITLFERTLALSMWEVNNNNTDEVSVFVNEGLYQTVEGLLEEMNRVVRVAFMDNELKLFHYNNAENYVYIINTRPIGHLMLLPCSVMHMLGFIRGTEGPLLLRFPLSQDYRRYRARYPPDLDDGIHYLFVYADFVESQHIDREKYKLLRTVPARKSIDTLITFENPQYRRVIRKNLRSIDINIRDHKGQDIKLPRGSTLCTFHFRKVQ